MPKAPYPAKPLPVQPLIRNCRFAFRCHQSWNSLEQTDAPHIRYCHECSREVILCLRDADLRAALQSNACVAVDLPTPSGRTRTIGVLHR